MNEKIKKRNAPTIKFEIEITRESANILEKLVATGLYGSNIADAAERLMCKKLLELDVKIVDARDI